MLCEYAIDVERRDRALSATINKKVKYIGIYKVLESLHGQVINMIDSPWICRYTRKSKVLSRCLHILTSESLHQLRPGRLDSRHGLRPFNTRDLCIVSQTYVPPSVISHREVNMSLRCRALSLDIDDTIQYDLAMKMPHRVAAVIITQ